MGHIKLLFHLAEGLHLTSTNITSLKCKSTGNSPFIMKHTAALIAYKGDDDGYLYVFKWDSCESTMLFKSLVIF